MPKILSIARGRAQQLAPAAFERSGSTVASGIVKSPVSTLEDPAPVTVGPLGIEHDEQADPTVHGGRDKAIYAYASEHYPVWQTLRRQALQDETLLPYGFMGENLTLAGLTEGDVYIGDVITVGRGADAVILRITAPREPCFKFNRRMGFNQAAKMMVQSGYTGFYLEVMRTGILRAGDPVTVAPGERVITLLEQHRLTTRR